MESSKDAPSLRNPSGFAIQFRDENYCAPLLGRHMRGGLGVFETMAKEQVPAL